MSNRGQLIWAKGPPSSAGQAAPAAQVGTETGWSRPGWAEARRAQDPDGRPPPAGKMVGMYELIIELLQAKAAVLADVDLGSGPPERLLVRSNLTGTMQLYEFEEGSGLCQVTDLPEPVATANYVPGGRQAVIAVDSGGNERHQLYLLDLGPGNERGASRPAGPARPEAID